MTTPKEILGSVRGGRVLDIATGNGQFIGFLVEGLSEYDEIVGIDTNERAEQAFRVAFKDRTAIDFAKMDALEMSFPDAACDTVCISNSLHHMSNLPRVLGEMRRVLKPEGHFVVAEMYCDGQAETQLTHVLLHHWWAAIDSAQGTFHAETYSRERILEVVGELGLEDLLTYDLVDLTSDPKDPATVAQLSTAVERTVGRVGASPNQSELAGQGEALRRRVHDVGFHNATTLLAIGRKPRGHSET